MNPHQQKPQVGANETSTSILWFVLGAVVAGAGVWMFLRSRPGSEVGFSPVKNLSTGDVACLPDTATASMFSSGGPG